MKVKINKIILVSVFVFGTRSLLFSTHTSAHLEIATTEYTRSHDRSENGDSISVPKAFGFISQDSDVPRNFVRGEGGFQQIQLRIEDRENGDLGAVAP